ncbi:hypothetical protein SprV_0100280100 [Sparganum proliferum]
MRNDIGGRLPRLPQSIQNCLKSLRLSPQRSKFATITGADAPTLTGSDEPSTKFYENLQALLTSVLKANRWIVLGYFCARAATDCAARRGVLGPHGLGSSNDNAIILLRTCAEHRHILTNTFCLPMQEKATSVVALAPAVLYHRSKARRAGRAGDKGDSVCRRVDQSSPHHLQDKNPPTASELAQRLVNLPFAAVAEENASVENRWCRLRGTVQPTTLVVLGRARHQHQDWFDDNDASISNLLVEKNRLHKTYVIRPTHDNKATFKHSPALYNSGCGRFRTPRRFAKPRTSTCTRAATNGRASSLLSRLSTVPHSREPLLFSAPTQLPYSLRRRKFYSDGPNTSDVSSTVHPPSPAPPSPVCLKWRSSRVLPSSSAQETIRAVQQLSSGKATARKQPQLHFPLHMAGKIFALILPNRLNNHLEEGPQPDSQCGFRVTKAPSI